MKPEYKIALGVGLGAWVYLGFLLLLSVLAGCTTVRESRSLVVPPHQGPVVVTTTATSRCSSIFMIITCDLVLHMWDKGDGG